MAVRRGVQGMRKNHGQITDNYKHAHCRSELQRGHVSRCPKSWLRVCKRLALKDGDLDLAAACDIALTNYPKGGTREMRRLAGRQIST